MHRALNLTHTIYYSRDQIIGQYYVGEVQAHALKY